MCNADADATATEWCVYPKMPLYRLSHAAAAYIWIIIVISRTNSNFQSKMTSMRTICLMKLDFSHIWHTRWSEEWKMRQIIIHERRRIKYYERWVCARCQLRRLSYTYIITETIEQLYAINSGDKYQHQNGNLHKANQKKKRKRKNYKWRRRRAPLCMSAATTDRESNFVSN